MHSGPRRVIRLGFLGLPCTVSPWKKTPPPFGTSISTSSSSPSLDDRIDAGTDNHCSSLPSISFSGLVAKPKRCEPLTIVSPPQFTTSSISEIQHETVSMLDEKRQYA